MVMSRRPSVVLVALLAAPGCAAERPPAAPLSHPSELLGRWVRLRADSTWGDTLDFTKDGRILGSVGHTMPEDSHWGVRPGSLGSHLLCAQVEKEAYCQTYRFEGAVMVLGGGPSGPTYFRRPQ